MIGDARLVGQVEAMLSSPEPGLSLHFLHVLSAPAGVLDGDDAVAVQVYRIAAAGPDEVDRFLGEAVVAARVRAHRGGVVVVFAGLSYEAWSVRDVDGSGRRMQAEGRLCEHPDAAQVTVVYGVCRDGRRWTGRRWLSGPNAGTAEDIVMLRGRPALQEGGRAGRLVRALAGVHA